MDSSNLQPIPEKGDSEIVHRLVLDSIATRVRNCSTSRGRRSYSAQTRPIAPASHSRDIEARYSDSWKGPRFVNHTDSSGSEKSNNERERSYRSASHHQRPKTLQIVEVGSAPYKYSVVRHVEEPQSESVREGRSRSRVTKPILKKPERNEQCNVVESNISFPNAEKEFKAGVNKANDNINNKDKSPLLKRIDIQLPSTNKQRTNNETKKNYNLQYSVTISPSKNQVDENIDIQSDEDSSVSSPTLNRKSINLREKSNVTTTPQKEHLFSSNKGLKSLDKDKRNCDDNNPKNDSLLKNLTCNKSRFSEPIVFIDHIERQSKKNKKQIVWLQPIINCQRQRNDVT